MVVGADSHCPPAGLVLVAMSWGRGVEGGGENFTPPCRNLVHMCIQYSTKHPHNHCCSDVVCWRKTAVTGHTLTKCSTDCNVTLTEHRLKAAELNRTDQSPTNIASTNTVRYSIHQINRRTALWIWSTCE